MVEVASQNRQQGEGIADDAACPRAIHREKLLEKIPSGPGCYRYDPRPFGISTFKRARWSPRSLPYRAERPGAMSVRCGRRRRRTGWGINPRRRHVHIRHHGQAQAGLPASFRRHNLCRRSIREVKLADGKLEKPDDSGKRPRSPRRRRIRAAPIQFPRRQCARLQRRGADLVQWTTRSHQQTFVFLSRRRTTPRDYKERDINLLAARRPAHSPRDVSDARKHRRPGRVYRTLSLWPAFDGLHAGMSGDIAAPNGRTCQTVTVPTSYFSGPINCMLKRALLIRAPLEGDRVRHAAQASSSMTTLRNKNGWRAVCARRRPAARSRTRSRRLRFIKTPGLPHRVA